MEQLSELLNYLWIIVSAALVFFMQPGFQMLESGMTREKNSINVAIKNLTDMGISFLLYWAIGFAFMFGNDLLPGVFGFSRFCPDFWGAGSKQLAIFLLFQAMFCSTSATIVSGAVAERMKFSAYIIVTCLISGIIYPVFGHWAWGGFQGDAVSSATGWLQQIGFVDFAGSSVVHSVGGYVGLAGIIVMGARNGRFAADGTARKIQGSNVPLAVAGVFVLWFGWIGFNGGSTLAMNYDVAPVILNTCLGAAAGLAGALFVGWIVTGLPDVDFVINGTLAGLVAVTANCHCVTPLEAIIIGAAGGVIMLGASFLLEKLRLDDAVGAVPVHLAAGIWGTLAVGIFGDPEILGTEPLFGSQLLAQAVGVAACGVWAFGLSFILLFIFNRISPLRVSESDEHKGLNIAEHGASTEIFELYAKMGEQAATGDLSIRLPTEPFTEIGQIATLYNKVMDGLEQTTMAQEEYTEILDNISDGLFLLAPDLNVCPNYSAATEKIMCRRDLAGLNFSVLMKPALPEKEWKSLGDYAELLFDPQYKMHTITRLNPLHDAHVFIDTGNGQIEKKYLDFSFTRIYGKNKKSIAHVMVLVRDNTRRFEMEQEMAAERQRTETEMNVFYRILHLDPELFSDFVAGFEADLNKINGILESGSGTLRSQAETIFRLVHSVKGNAALLDLDFIAEAAHAFEDTVKGITDRESIVSADFIPVTVRLREMYDSLDSVTRMVDKLMNFRKVFSDHNTLNADLIALSLKNLAEKIAVEQGKSVQFRYEAFHAAQIPKECKKRIQDILIQLIRNSVSHGIETPELRIERSKNTAGLLEISTAVENGILTVCVKDDGSGIDFAKIEKKLRAQKRSEPLPEGGFSRKDLFAAIFSGGISTADTADVHRGRGVGMSYVKTLAEELHAKLTVKTRQHEFCEFRLSVPIEAAGL
ncbi:ammonium transporter [Treponema brennaborense]|uniref:Multi-sensor signal transduction histidine kinase n=1 Tax=Treponema brennaborense (strain DSM 12168 / CIP 105900 / DD5/3) TaxID=906968 RepID=F4LLV5_TREBD|nr:ammonium transporter [Treponema brennaborense]AEE15647.1 multi-sensor signal transduction histidine kinase [Treponema brennaborense DSM 12168]